jgi:hypothetical protein
MIKFKHLAVILAGTCSIASAQEVWLTGHVQKVILQPSGTENCPPVCPVNPPVNPNGLQTVCITNLGGCETMEVKVDHVYRGAVQEGTRQFTARIGEWGPNFPATGQQILVSEVAGSMSWWFVREREGKLYVERKRAGYEVDSPLVPLADMIAQIDGSTR